MDKILTGFQKSGLAAFRTRTYAALLGKSDYARLVLHRLNKKGEIAPVKNGWWAFSNANFEAIASEISNPGYISFYSALSLHELTTQIPKQIQIAVIRKPKHYKVFDTVVKEYRIKKKDFTGYSKKDGILLASPEKAMADALNYPKTCPKIVIQEALNKINKEKLNDLLSAAGKKRLNKMISYAK